MLNFFIEGGTTVSEKYINIQIEDNQYEINPGLTTGEALYQLIKSPSDQHTLVLDVPDELDIPILASDSLILRGGETFALHEGCLALPENPPLRQPMNFYLNGHHYTGDKGFTQAKISTEDLAKLLEDNEKKYLFVIDIDGQVDIVLPESKPIVLSSGWDILAFPINKPPSIPCNEPEHYLIKVDGTEHRVNTPSMLGQEIILLSGKADASKHELNQILQDGSAIPIELSKKAHFTDPGIECFVTIPLDMTEGFTPRRQFSLPPEDMKFLDSLDTDWETVIEGHSRRVIIYEILLPEGYTEKSVAVNLRIESGYPEAQIDMAYFFPDIKRIDGKPIKATIQDQFDQRSWQRWSRHRTSANPWRPGIDNISTHLCAIQQWLAQELLK